nr:MAG TPA: hypothetical protein [Caudoviricetes sp.]
MNFSTLQDYLMWSWDIFLSFFKKASFFIFSQG